MEFTKEDWERTFAQETVVDWANMMHDLDAVVVDVETTGPGNGDEIIDIAVVRAINGEVLLSTLVKPQERIKPQAYNIHRISHEMLEDAPRFVDIYEELYWILYERYSLAYNSPFDSRLTNFTCERYGLRPPVTDWRCIMKAYKLYTGYPKNVTLVRACEEMNVLAGNHRAETDALAAARVLYRIAKGYGKCI